METKKIKYMDDIKRRILYGLIHSFFIATYNNVLYKPETR